MFGSSGHGVIWGSQALVSLTAASDSAGVKRLLNGILSKTRSEDAEVRLCSVKACCYTPAKFTNRVSEPLASIQLSNGTYNVFEKCKTKAAN